MTRASHYVKVLIGTLLAVVLATTASGQLIFKSGFEAGEAASELPPDPMDIAPPRKAGYITPPWEAYEFLFNETDPVQFEADVGQIDQASLSVLRGKVVDTLMNPLPGIRVDVPGHPEFGYTLSRADGEYDLAVNGGGMVRVTFTAAGYLPVERRADTNPQADTELETVMMTPLDPAVTTVSSFVPAQVITGSTVTDIYGTRTARLIMPNFTQITMDDGNGNMVPQSQINVRLTEYTVGENGPMAMPAALPPTSAYTYALEMSADEGLTQRVEFDPPLASYNENFLDLPTGTVIPSASYDREKGYWIPDVDGRIIEILSESGLATIAVNGNGAPANPGELFALGITTEELQLLADLYEPGDTLWRVPISHFSPHDFNFSLPGNAGPPDQPRQTQAPINPNSSGSDYGQIEYETQVFKEALDLVGVPFSLHYASDRTRGRTGDRKIEIVVTDADVDPNISSIELAIGTNGQLHNFVFDGTPNQTFEYTWDGLDAYGRPVYGTTGIGYTLNYIYPLEYAASINQPGNDEPGRSFGAYRQVPGLGPIESREVIVPRQYGRRIQAGLDWRAVGVAGWSPSVHHFYDPVQGVVYRGDGTRQGDGGSPLVRTLNTFAGGGTFQPDGGTATETEFNEPEDLAVAADGTVYVASREPFNGSQLAIRKIAPDGIVSTVVGFGNGLEDCPETGAIAREMFIYYGNLEIALSPTGQLYFTASVCEFEDPEEGFFYRTAIYRLEDDGTVTRLAGDLTHTLIDFDPLPPLFGAEDARTVPIYEIDDLLVLDDGSIVFADYGRLMMYRIATDGTLSAIWGNGTGLCVTNCDPDGTEAIGSSLPLVDTFSKLPDGSILAGVRSLNQGANEADGKLVRLSTDGLIYTYATFDEDTSPEHIALAPDGTVYVTRGFPFGADIIAVDGVESFRVIAGGLVDQPYAGPGSPARQTRAARYGLAVGPDGAVYASRAPEGTIERISPQSAPIPLNASLIASPDGTELYQFAASGQHLETRHTLTGELLWQFGYDGEQRLVTVTDGYGNQSTINRNAGGDPVSITGPYGQTTTLALDANKFLSAATAPGGSEVSFEYTADGLLTAVETGTDDRYTMTYTDGFLTSVTDPAGGGVTLSRTDIPGGFRVTETTAEGAVTHFDVVRDVSDTVSRTTTLPDSTSRMVVTETSGTETTVDPDGTMVETMAAADPRFGMQSPFPAQTTVSLPGGSEQVSERTRSAVLEPVGTVLDLDTLTETLDVAGETTTYTYTGATRTELLDLPDGRQLTRVLNPQGDALSISPDGWRATTIVLDPQGRATSVTRGQAPNDSTTLYERDANGRVDLITQPDGTELEFGWGLDGQRDSITLEDDAMVLFSHDAAGFETSITPPGRPAYLLQPDNRQLLNAFVAPPVDLAPSTTTFAYDLDRNLTSVTDPDARTVTNVYSANRLDSHSFSGGAINFSYNGATGRLDQVAAPDVTVDRTYDGFWLAQETWSGDVSGSVETPAAANDLVISEISVNDADAVSYTYDSHRRVTGAGALTLTRDSQSGRIDSSTLSIVTDVTAYDAVGRLSGYTASVSATPVFSYTLEYDSMDRIVSREETIGGVTTDYDYSYDDRGRLETVSENSVLAVTYDYDANGNRISIDTGGGPVTTTYDDQDRIVLAGTIQFDYLDSGYLETITDGLDITSFSYDELGNLTQATLPSGAVITYLADGFNRRVGRATDGTTDFGLLYQDRIRVAAALDDSQQVIQRYVHIPDSLGAPEYIVQGGDTYRIVKDHLGSVRLVIDTATGAIVQRLDYDPWGVVLTDTSPGFQPFGFAGGQYDADTGLVRFSSRDYHPATGRWTAPDPWQFDGGDANLYSYVFNQPTSLFDPTGHHPLISVYNGIASTLLNDAIDGAPPGTVGLVRAARAGRIDPIAAATSAGIFFGRQATRQPMIDAAENYYSGPRNYATPETFGLNLNGMSPQDRAFAQQLVDGYNNGTFNSPTVRAWVDALKEKYARMGKQL